MSTDNAAAGTTNSGDASAAGGTPPAAADQNQGTGAPAAASSSTEGGAKAGAQGSDDKGKPGGDAAALPEKYEFTMPEGIELDGDAAGEFGAIAKELKLSQADAQRIADVAVKMQQKQAEAHVTTVRGWADQCKTDKEFGGDNLEQNLAVARKAIDAFGSSELKTLLNSTGLGSHPELVRFAYKAGKAISEDTFRQAGTRAPTPEQTLEKRLYPNMN